MALRQWMVTHEWMVKPTPQTEWIERRGMLVWIAEVFTSLGAGLYLVSLFFNNWWGMLVAWVIIMFLKVPLHLIYFGKPFRFWRTIPPFTNAWKTSWFTRGITFSVIYLAALFLSSSLLPTRYEFLPRHGLGYLGYCAQGIGRHIRLPRRHIQRLHHELLPERSVLEYGSGTPDFDFRRHCRWVRSDAWPSAWPMPQVNIAVCRGRQPHPTDHQCHHHGRLSLECHLYLKNVQVLGDAAAAG